MPGPNPRFDMAHNRLSRNPGSRGARTFLSKFPACETCFISISSTNPIQPTNYYKITKLQYQSAFHEIKMSILSSRVTWPIAQKPCQRYPIRRYHVDFDFLVFWRIGNHHEDSCIKISVYKIIIIIIIIPCHINLC